MPQQFYPCMQLDDIRAGCVLRIPRKKSSDHICCERRSRLCDRNCFLKEGGYKHPILVINVEGPPRAKRRVVTFLTMTSTPMDDDDYSQYSPIGHTFPSNFMSELRSRYWLKEGRSMEKLTYLRLFHTYKKTITNNWPYFATFEKPSWGNPNPKADDYRLTEDSFLRLQNRLAKPPAIPWPHYETPAQSQGGPSSSSLSNTDLGQESQVESSTPQQDTAYQQGQGEGHYYQQQTTQQPIIPWLTPYGISVFIGNMRTQLDALYHTLDEFDFWFHATYLPG